MIRAILSGAAGRMGSTMLKLMQSMDDFSVVACIDPSLGTTFVQIEDAADVCIDFSTPTALSEVLSYCVRQHVPLVLATTGYTPIEQISIDKAAAQIAILQTANLSYGAYVLTRLAKEAQALLENSYDVTIIETHHCKKKDAPSGTAKSIARVLGAQASHVQSIRGGSVVSIHEVQFHGEQDSIALKYESHDRMLFARGALQAAKWIASCAPGLYDTSDMWG